MGSDASDNKVTIARTEGGREAVTTKPDLVAANLYRENGGTGGTAVVERPNVTTADGKQVQFSNVYAQHDGFALPFTLGGQPGATPLDARIPGQTPPPSDGTNGANSAALQSKAADLFNPNLTPQQKLATVQELAQSGITNLSYTDSSGTSHQMRLELEGLGNKQMVHLFTEGPDGKERVALRGIANGDGTFRQETNRRGHAVSFEGSDYRAISGQSGTPGSISPEHNIPLPPRRPDPSSDTNGGTQPDTSTRPTDAMGTIDRSQFDSQLNDPRVMAAFAGRMHTEVGSQGHAAQVAWAESVMNRAASRHISLMQALSGSYYPTSRPGSSHNPEYIASITEAWKEGTDTTHGATGNSSGTVGFGVRGGHYDANHHWVSPNQTARYGGERFGVEQVDVNKGWLAMYERLKASGSIASRQHQSALQPTEMDA